MRNGLPSIPSIPTAIRSVDSGHVFDVESVRQDMPSVRASAYFNAGTFGPLPRAADDAMRAHMNASFERGRTRLDDWFLLQEEARRAFARTLFAHVDAVALMHCTTDAINTVISGLTFDDGDEIVTTTDEHPGVTAPLEELARRHRIAVHVVEPRAEAIVKAIGERTRLIAISHVLWTTGDVLPVAEIAAAAREYGALVLVDGAQAVGAIDVDPENLGADFYAASGQKWLCGPSGTGALWIRPANEHTVFPLQWGVVAGLHRYTKPLNSFFIVAFPAASSVMNCIADSKCVICCRIVQAGTWVTFWTGYIGDVLDRPHG
jgi:L-cysteine/cystine lyase